VHLSNPDERDDWRKLSVIRDVVAARFVGQGAEGYRLGLEYLKENA
jgi:3-dehydroquinate dehydratase